MANYPMSEYSLICWLHMEGQLDWMNMTQLFQVILTKFVLLLSFQSCKKDSLSVIQQTINWQLHKVISFCSSIQQIPKIKNLAKHKALP